MTNEHVVNFALEEYDKIASAFFNLQDKISDWFRLYVAVIGLPIAVLAAVWNSQNGASDIRIPDLPYLVLVLSLVAGLLGFFISMIIVSIRFEMILYARTVNGIRRYFAELDGQHPRRGKSKSAPLLLDFLILPTNDGAPPFFEIWKAIFLQVLTMGLFNGSFITVFLIGLELLPLVCNLLLGSLFGLFHLVAYWLFARRREQGWKHKFPEDLGQFNY